MGRILGCGSDDCAACAAGLPFACTYLTHDEDHQQPARPQLIANIADTGIPYTDPPGRTWIPQHMQPSASGLDVEDNNSQHVLNMRMKIHNATPGELPPGLHDSLLQITGAPSDSIRGWIRPGCVDLSVDFWFNDTASYDRALMSLEQAILNPEVAMEGMPWRKHETDVQLPTMSAIVSPGGTVELIRRDTAGPAIDRVLQPATAGYNVTLMVSNLPRSSWKVLCRRAGGVFQTLEVLAVDEDLPHGQHFVDVG